jgi:hypothetical protein
MMADSMSLEPTQQSIISTDKTKPGKALIGVAFRHFSDVLQAKDGFQNPTVQIGKAPNTLTSSVVCPREDSHSPTGVADIC